MRVEFFPPNKTCKIQPLAAGIIAPVNTKYWYRLLLRVFRNFEAERKSIYNVDVLTKMRWTCEELHICPSHAIRNSFNYCLKQGERAQQTAKEMNTSVTLENMERDSRAHGVQFTRAGLENLLKPLNKDEFIQELFIEMLGERSLGYPQAQWPF